MIVYGIAAKLPSIDVLRSRCQSLAVLERIIDTGEPYYTYTRELWPGLLEGLPAVFSAHAEEPAFGNEDGDLLATAVLWRLRGDDRWQAAPNITFPASRGPYDTGPDGSDLLEILLDDIADQYIAFAEDYYEMPVDRNPRGRTRSHSRHRIPSRTTLIESR